MEVADVSQVRRFAGRIVWTVTVVAAVVSSYRLIPHVLVIGCAIAWLARPAWRRLRFAGLVAVGWFRLHASPYDVSTISRRGGPRIMRLLLGEPTRETAESANRDGVVLGGCLISGLEPRRILVW